MAEHLGQFAPPTPKPPSRTSPTTSRRPGWLGVAVGMVLGMAASGVVMAVLVPGGRSPTLGAEVLNPPRDVATARVRVETVKPRVGAPPRTTQQPGSIRSFEHAELYARVSGYLKTLAVDIGDEVQAGQVIAELDVPELDTAVLQAQAALTKAQAGAKQAERQIETARATVKVTEAKQGLAQAELEAATSRMVYRRKERDRIADLAQRRAVEPKLVEEQDAQYAATASDVHASESGVRSVEAQVLESQAKVDQAIADAETARAQVAVAQADLDRARVFQGFARIVSPYTGIITARNVHPGDFIRVATEGAGLPLLAVARNDLMRVVVQVPDRDVPLVDRGDPATIRFDATGDTVFHGTVARFSAQENEQTRTMRTEIDMPNPDGKLRDGMYGSVIITLKPGDSTLSVPSSALNNRDGGEGELYVVRDGQAHRLKVRVGRDSGVETEILDGLQPDDQVVTRTLGALHDGSAVAVSPQEKPQTP